MIGSRLIKSNDVAAGCEDIVDNYDPFDGNGVALYQLNGNANDVSGNYDGAFTAPAYGAGVFGQAGVFNGSSSYVSGFPTLTNVSGSYSISVWAKFNSLPTTGNVFAILGAIKEQGAVDSVIALRVLDNGNILFRTRGTEGISHDILSEQNYSGQWHNIVITQDSSSKSMYIDGQNINTLSVSQNVLIDNCMLGARSNRGTVENYFNGSIDQVRVFNTVLTPLEVEALYTEELCICDGTVDTLDILGDGSCIAAYQLDGNANDLSGNYSGTPTDVSYGVGEFDLAGVFNASSSRINTSNLKGFSTQTWSLWIKPDVVDSRGHLLSTYPSGTIGEGAMYIELKVDGRIEAGVRDGGVTKTVTSASSLTANQWVHIAVTSDGSNIKLYINAGSPIINTATVGSLDSANVSPLAIGYDIRNNLNYFDGSIDQVRIFNKALTLENVQTLYNETACTYTPKSNLILHLDANDSNSWTGSGSTWFDVSGNDYNADILTPVPSTGTVGSTTYLNLSTRDDYFKIPIATHGGALSPKSGNKLTYLYWMNLPSVATGVDGICVYHITETAAGNKTSYSRYYKPSVEGHTPWFYDNAGTRDINPGYLAPSTQNKWMMVVLTMDYTTGLFGFHRFGDGMTTYHNYNMGTVNPYPTADSDIFFFNSNEPTYGGYGYVGEIKVFDKPLDEIEMGIEYNNGKIKYGIS